MSDDRPTFGSLFAGIGGIDLGLERAGWRGRWQVEYEPFCQKVLAKHWPDVQRYGDICDVDWSGVERVDLIAGGFPCQPVSVAGKRLGQDDDRWLWPQFVRAIRSLGPRYVLVENVPGLLVRGMGDVQRDLAELGYRRWWDVLAAADFGAPHLRKRVWIVAGRTELAGSLADAGGGRGPDDGLRAGRDEPRSGGATLAHAERMGPVWYTDPADWDYSNGHDAGRSEEAGRTGERSRGDREWKVADADALGRNGRARQSGSEGWRQPANGGRQVPHANGGDAQGIVEERDDEAHWRISSERPLGLFGGAGRDSTWPPEPDVGRVAHGVPARVDRLRSLGNAVVPQVVEFIGRRILEAEALT